ncbi:MAG: 2-oxoglutarate and iron-dependent oxygenase domain-containing protein [Alphaproteobacteria bacterium]|nr:isopenicillin N synthase family oxygenase [Rhodospirillaceae bacterium]MDG2479520.1 2-oxoglutarate and iron-dependent oxygenase domain-containing protein [Alphaproteobacteria bacterium]
MTHPIPLIDMTPWYDGSTADKSAVVDAVRGTCEGIGFFMISGHRVDPGLIQRMYDTSRAFFDLPEEEKATCPPIGEVPGGLMHFAYGMEKLAATMGVETPPDRKEALDYGPLYHGSDWPVRPAGLQRAWHDYYDALDRLCFELRAILALAAGLAPDHFEHCFENHLSSVRVLDYPEQEGPQLPGQLRAGAHTDYGFLTVLRSEDRPGGLEVMNLDDQWIAPPAIAGSYIVNLGDSLMRWTDDMWRSTPHRVVNPPEGAAGSRRQAIAFFHNPGRDALIDTLPTFRHDDVAPKYPPITYGEYSIERQQRAHPEHISAVV